MILTCPECASRYFVDDARVGANGRTVRCASCAHTWRAERQIEWSDADAPLTLTPSEPGAAAQSAKTEAAAPPPLPKRIRAEAIEKKKTREAVTAGVVWAGLGAGFVALVLASVLFRVDVVHLWPQTASAYAFAKMPVNPTGLAIETVQGQPTLINGHAALAVTAVERNVEIRPVTSMPLRVILYDKGGKRLTSSVNAPPSRQIAPGDTRLFAVNFIDPPADGSSFVVEFAFDKVGKAVSAKTVVQQPGKAPGKLALRGPVSAIAPPAPMQAQDAKPLPANSPYALPSSAAEQTAR